MLKWIGKLGKQIVNGYQDDDTTEKQALIEHIADIFYEENIPDDIIFGMGVGMGLAETPLKTLKNYNVNEVRLMAKELMIQ